MMREPAETTKTLNVREIWQLVKRFRWYLIMPMIVIPLAAILATFFIPPTYESSTLILIKESSILPPLVQRGLGSETRMAYQLTASELNSVFSNQLKSTKYIKSLIAKLDIPMPEKIRNAVSERSPSLVDISPAELSENLLVQAIRNNIDVSISGTNLIKISIRSSSPLTARRMTLTLAEIFLEESLAQELAGIQGSISFTEEQLVLYREKLFSAQNKLKNFRQEMIASSVDEDTTTLNYSLNSIFSAVEALDIEISDLEGRKNDLALSLRTYKVEPAAASLPDNIVRSKSNLMNTIPRLAELLSRYSWRDAKVIALNQEAKDFTTAIENDIKDYVPRANPGLPAQAIADLTEYLILDLKLEYMRTKSMSMEKSIGKIKARLTRDPDIEVTLDRLQSEVNRYQELYNLFVQHSQYAAIDQSAKKVEAQSKYMIVQPAIVPLAPISPNRMKMLIIGIVLGLLVGSVVVFIILILDDSFKRIEEVEEYLKLPVLATIPLITTPYAAHRKDRGLIYGGAVVSLLLVAAIIYMKFKSG